MPCEILNVAGLVQDILPKFRLSPTKIELLLHQAPHLHALQAVDSKCEEIIRSRKLNTNIFLELLDKISLELWQRQRNGAFFGIATLKVGVRGLDDLFELLIDLRTNEGTFVRLWIVDVGRQ